MSAWGPIVDRRRLLAWAPGAALGLSGIARAVPSQPSLNFLVVGDWGRNGHAFQRHVAVQMGRFGTAIDSRFTISTGDNFYNLGVSSPSDPQWETSFEEVYTEQPLQSAWYPVLGNHDYGGDITAQIARTRTSSRWQMRDRWFEVGPSELGRSDTHLFFIDTVLWRGRESFPFSWLGSSIRPEDSARQREWLIGALGRCDATHKIVFGHYPVYSVGPHGGHGPSKEMADLDAILRANGVTAYVCGHDHCLYYIELKGMHYVCSGGGSQELQHYTGDPKSSGCVLPGVCGPGDPIWYSYLDRAGFAAFSISDAGIDFAFIDRSGFSTPFTRLARPPCGSMA